MKIPTNRSEVVKEVFVGGMREYSYVPEPWARNRDGSLAMGRQGDPDRLVLQCKTIKDDGSVTFSNWW